MKTGTSKQKLFLSAMIFIVSLAIVAIYLISNSVAKAGPSPLQSNNVNLNQPGWATKSIDNLQIKFQIVPQDNDIYWVYYDYPRKTISDVKLVQNTFKDNAGKLATTKTAFKSTIVFAYPIPVNEFITFTKAMNLTPSASEVRGVDATGSLLKIGLPPEWSQDSQGKQLVGQPLLNGSPIDLSRLTTIHWRTSFRVVGVVSTDVELDNQTYHRVIADNKVSTIDVLPQILIDEVKRQYPNAQDRKIFSGGSILYAAMEKVNIAAKP